MALALGGALQIASALVDLNINHAKLREEATTGAYAISSVLGLLPAILLLGLNAHQSNEASILGLVGFLEAARIGG